MSEIIRCNVCDAERPKNQSGTATWHHPYRVNADGRHSPLERDYCSFACLAKWATAEAVREQKYREQNEQLKELLDEQRREVMPA